MEVMELACLLCEQVMSSSSAELKVIVTLCQRGVFSGADGVLVTEEGVMRLEGPHLCVGHVIVTVHCLCIPAMYGGNFAVRRLSHDAETLPPYLDESALVPEQEADGETAGSDQSACSEWRFSACLERRDDRRPSQLVIWLQ